MVQKRIEDGRAGVPGIPGKGGKNKRHGMDYGAYAECARFRGKVVNILYAQDHRIVHPPVRGELRHPNIPPPGYGDHFIRPGNGLPRQTKSSCHPDFVDRGFQQAGRPARVNINFAIAKENRAVDKDPVSYQHGNYVRKLHNTGIVHHTISF